MRSKCGSTVRPPNFLSGKLAKNLQSMLEYTMRNDFARGEFSLNRFSRSIWFVSLACGDFRTPIFTVPILGFKFSELITTLSCILEDYSLDITRINENLHDQTSECSKVNGKRRNQPAPKSVRKSISRIHFFHAGRRFPVAPEVE